MSEIGFVQIQLELLQGMHEIILQFHLSPFDCRQLTNYKIKILLMANILAVVLMVCIFAQGSSGSKKSSKHKLGKLFERDSKVCDSCVVNICLCFLHE